MLKSRFLKILIAASILASFTGVLSPLFAEEELSGSGFEIPTQIKGFNIGPALYKNGNGEVIDSVTAGETVTSGVTVKNLTAEAKNITMICALYDAQGLMKDIVSKIFSARVNKTVLCETSVDVPSEADNGWSIKTYIVENYDNMYSYCESFSLPAEKPVETSWDMGQAFRFSSEKVYDGFSALCVSGNVSECEQPVSLKQNSMYKMRFFGIGDTDMDYSVRDLSGETVLNEKAFEKSADWSLNSMVFKTGDEEDNLVRFSYKGNGKAFIDNVAVSDNILINGDFEEDYTGWQTDADCFEVGKNGAYEGKRALKITSKGAGSRICQMTEVIPYSKCMISFKSKCSDKISLKVLDSGLNDLPVKTEAVAEVSSSWQDNHIYVNTMDNTELAVCFETTSATGNISYIDNVEFTNLPFPDELKNAGFEDETEGWMPQTATLDISSENVHSGNACGMLTERTKPYSRVSQDVTKIVNKYGPGSYYIESFVRPDESITHGWMVIRLYYTPKDGAEQIISFTVKNPESGKWYKIGGKTDIEFADEVTNAKIVIESSLESGAEDPAVTSDIFIDDVSFFKMPD